MASRELHMAMVGLKRNQRSILYLGDFRSAASRQVPSKVESYKLGVRGKGDHENKSGDVNLCARHRYRIGTMWRHSRHSRAHQGAPKCRILRHTDGDISLTLSVVDVCVSLWTDGWMMLRGRQARKP